MPFEIMQKCARGGKRGTTYVCIVYRCSQEIVDPLNQSKSNKGKYVAYVWVILWRRCPPFFMTFLLPWSRVWFVAPSQGFLVPMVLPNPPI